VIEFRQVGFRYPQGGRDAIAGIDLRIEEGSLVGLMGGNGSGKSTMVRLMNALLIPGQGTVVVDGLNTRDPVSATEIRKKVGVVFQDPNLQLTSMTVEEELAFGLENLGVGQARMECKVEEVLRSFALTDVRSLPPYSHSGGQKQRVALAAVMILDPKYLILDEATTLLAPAGRTEILRMATSTARGNGTTLIVVTQNFSEIRDADRLLVLHRGRMVLDEPPSALLQRWEVLEGFGVPVPLGMKFPQHEL
jgi:energy-coupling factor transport system ATP-binding protein